jgi:hypothetical protein
VTAVRGHAVAVAVMGGGDHGDGAGEPAHRLAEVGLDALFMTVSLECDCVPL